jgi:hypothetical protein
MQRNPLERPITTKQRVQPRIRGSYLRSPRTGISGCFLVLGFLIWFNATTAQGQEKQLGMMSIEWLVDESDVIAIVLEKQTTAEQKVLKTIKGSSESVDWHNLRIANRAGFVAPPSQITRNLNHQERVRLMFVRGREELLQAVSLERSESIASVKQTTHPDYKPYPRLGFETKLYGVTQFGELLLTEAKLFRAIEDRIKIAHQAIPLRPSCGKHLGSDGILPARSAPDSFPLNNDDETYYLVVPYDASRLDYFLSLLSKGDAAEKLYAIRELAIFDDTSATNAIERAANCIEAREVFHFKKSSGEVVALTTADVRAAADAELQKLR